MNFNKAIILGRLTNDPDQRTLPSGQPVVNFSVATNRVYTGQDGNKQEFVEFHNVVAFGKLADICARYLKKGGLVLVDGRIQTRNWQDKDGNKRYRTEIVMENMQLGPRPAGGSGNYQTSNKSTPAAKQQIEEIPVIDQETPIASNEENIASGNENKEEEEINVDNIPF